MLYFLIAVWAGLMIYSVRAELRYYHAVQEHEPGLWQKIGAPTLFKIPFVFLNKKKVQQLKLVNNPTVLALARKNKQAQYFFIGYLVLVLCAAIVFFKFA
ncbi:hypothetical protein [Psychrobium sp. 1_MG-2023]|uniref:hypothetical protein n=1 Tax=Psychrobium sp. 1_MG-2023 TaxID=3062624 RepID=UPI000C337082|nr:hypothetical protein [Psychrobium sp. 1_MG-2023]MDP2562440.1 hypothetical protein [Psychrobium sp. 1_MG-2023]PKF56166.1 hypothetical protein CW748_10950 [Alteromonadales bacterium alter-6D02]